MSGETHTVEERNCTTNLIDKPAEVLGEYTLTRQTMLGKNSIQARLGGDGLPTTIKQLDEVVTHRGDMIAVQVNKRHVATGDNLSIARFKVVAFGDGGIHEAFDLTHCRGCLVDLISMAGDGGHCNPPCDTC